MKSMLYVGTTPVDLEEGDERLSLLPGGLYTFDEIKDKGKLALLKKLPEADVRDVTPKPVPVPPKKVAHASESETSSKPKKPK
jgi:hypothetical protein